ncbi:Vhr1-domain-containing protein [Ascoidea rubescens DSM 1968]|uniref:Vhr1-domain-containing protein n=1 Tax=Ascoidea rubescens DSM 1968 TaxID=1344418 RepID=A0A1D2VJD4_9ASCO|nr:Vhr1-domain-containing protein [Ascoidea rubescens DSM 1968]ODV61617.1 Vhr1-domain-containing protein [Ascoidea rubescens DSM 1968]
MNYIPIQPNSPDTLPVPNVQGVCDNTFSNALANNTHRHIHNNDNDASKIGITKRIRDELKFNDDRLWKRFSARRLELIDSFDLSSKKASEQDNDIKKVANTLRIEFNYDLSNLDLFDKLVRAAIQSVRRNRKRSSKFKSFISNNNDDDYNDNNYINHRSNNNNNVNNLNINITNNENNSLKRKSSFLSEFTKLTDLSSSTDYSNETYSKKKNFSSEDFMSMNVNKNKNKNKNLKLPSISSLESAGKISLTAASARIQLLSIFQKSKTCLDSTAKYSENLTFIGKSVIPIVISFILERYFTGISLSSIEYIRLKLTSDYQLAKLIRTLDKSPDIQVLPDSIASSSLYQLIGASIKDFGFDCIVKPFGEIFHEIIIRDFPLISNNNHNKSYYYYDDDNGSKLSTINRDKGAQITTRTSDEKALNSLAFTLSSLKTPFTKLVSLKFFNKVIYFSFKYLNSATPTLFEILKNGSSAFHIKFEELKLRDLNCEGKLLNNDFEVEKSFKKHGNVEFELFYPNNNTTHELTEDYDISIKKNNGSNNSRSDGSINKINANIDIGLYNQTETGRDKNPETLSSMTDLNSKYPFSNRPQERNYNKYSVYYKQQNDYKYYKSDEEEDVEMYNSNSQDSNENQPNRKKNFIPPHFEPLL